MMTIKHIEPDGTEHLFEVDSISRTPEGTLILDTHIKLTTGKFYVMNSFGKTVDYIDLNKKEQR
jgi:hypothetical protein